MKCSKCGSPKVIYKQEQSGQILCKECFIESIESKVIKTVRKEKLLDKWLEPVRDRKARDIELTEF